ncbi:hypothetical protein EDC04DRAFT_2686815 [Pisolithus marmoratus]|nr:hypothetical protein EDC04DRAFT_2686815 [Pisolithus marmoratus]
MYSGTSLGRGLGLDFSMSQHVVDLDKPPAYVLVKMNSTKIPQLEDLEENVIPIIPLERTYTIIDGNVKKTVTRVQSPLTSAYAFTDYRSQGQTIGHAIIDITSPPTGTLTPFNIYVSLSRSPRGKANIRLLRDFDEKLLTSHPSEYLRIEDERLVKLDNDTVKWWNEICNAHMIPDM